MKSVTSRRNVRRIAPKKIREKAEELNSFLAKGYRVITVPAGLVDALIIAINSAGGWRGAVKTPKDAAGNGSVLFTPDPTSLRDDESPLLAYDEIRRRSQQWVAAAAIEISGLLEDGHRVFKRPVGIADDLILAINAPEDDGKPSGWKASVRGRSDEEVIIDIDEDTSEDTVDVPPEVLPAAAA